MQGRTCCSILIFGKATMSMHCDSSVTMDLGIRGIDCQGYYFCLIDAISNPPPDRFCSIHTRDCKNKYRGKTNRQVQHEVKETMNSFILPHACASISTMHPSNRLTIMSPAKSIDIGYRIECPSALDLTNRLTNIGALWFLEMYGRLIFLPKYEGY